METKNTLEIITADDVSGYNPNLTLSWTDNQGERLEVTGEFDDSKGYYSHLVVDEEGNELYEVRG